VYLQTLDWFTILANNLPVDKGVLIVKVVPDSPAGAAGLKKGDIIIKFQDSEIETAQALQHAILECQIGQEVKITFVRGRDTKTTYAVLAQSLPPES
jgi:serine protease Do